MFHNAPAPIIEYGSIGWDDEAEYIFPGDESNDGHTYVRVQLFRGRDISKKLKQDRAHGIKLVAHVNALGGFRTPPKDTRCLVAVPPGMEQTPGAAIIMGVVEQSSARFDNLENGSVAMSAGQGQARVITNNDGSVTIFTTEDNTKDGKSVYVRVASDGIQFVAPWGTLRFDKSGFHILTEAGASLDLGGIYGLPAPLDALTSYVRMQAASIIGEAIAQSFGPSTGTPERLVGQEELKTVIDAVQTQITNIFLVVQALANALGVAITTPAGATPDASFAALKTAWGNADGNDLLAEMVNEQTPLVSAVNNGSAQMGKSTSST